MELFSGLSSAQQAALRQGGSITPYNAGKVLFKEGDIAHGLCCLMSGAVEIYRPTPQGDVRLALISPGELFGEMGLLVSSSCRTASARAVQDSFVFQLSSDPILIMKSLSVLDQGKGAIRLMQNIVHRLAVRLRRKEAPGHVQAPRHANSLLGGIKHSGLDDKFPSDAMNAIRKSLPSGLLQSWLHERKLKPGDFLFQQGEDSKSLFFIHEGRIELTSLGQGREASLQEHIAFLDGPSITGEVGYFLKEKRSNSAVAKTAVRATSFPSQDFDALAAKHPTEAFNLLFALAQWITWSILEMETPKN